MPGMKKSPRPTPNPRRSDPVSRGNAASRRQQSEQDDVLKNGGRGMMAGGKVKKMAYGGKVKKMKDGGFPDLNKDGKVTKADILQDRGVKKMQAGGKCRGMGAATRGGNFSRG